MVKEWFNCGSTWDNTLRAEAGKKPRSAEENNALIALMCGVGINTGVWCRPRNWTAFVGNNEGVDDLEMFYLQQMLKDVCC